MSEETIVTNETPVEPLIPGDSEQVVVEASPVELPTTQQETTTSAEVDSQKPGRKPKKPKAKYYIPLEVGQKLDGKIKTITDFGAFVDLNLAVDGLVHISELARRRVEKVTDVVTEGIAVTVWVKSVDKERGRIGLTMLKPIEHKFSDLAEGDVMDGVVTRIESYGVFVDIGLSREGLVHVSELAYDFVKVPSDVVSVGETVKVKVLKIDPKKKQVNLSIKALLQPPEPEVVEEVVEEVVVQPQQLPEAEEDTEDDSLSTSMAVAFGLLDTGKRASRKKQAKQQLRRNRELDDVINRTLRNNNS